MMTRQRIHAPSVVLYRCFIPFPLMRKVPNLLSNAPLSASGPIATIRNPQEPHAGRDADERMVKCPCPWV